METNDSDALHEALKARIAQRLAATGKSGKRAGEEAGTPSLIANINRGSRPAFDALAALARALDTTPEWLAYGAKADDRPEPRPSNDNPTIPVIGRVAAGTWLEIDTAVDAPLYERLPIPADPDYPVAMQFACEVEGTSVNRVAPHGAFLVCIDTRRARLEARPGNLVIVEQRRNDGQEIMRTAKRYHPIEDGVELWPDSDDPRWVTPMVIHPGEEEEGTQIEIIGLVRYVVAPLAQLDRARHIERLR